MTRTLSRAASLRRQHRVPYPQSLESSMGLVPWVVRSQAAPDELVATRAPSSHAQLQERVAARVLAAVETEALPSMHASPPALSPRARLRTPSEPAIPEELHDERG